MAYRARKTDQANPGTVKPQSQSILETLCARGRREEEEVALERDDLWNNLVSDQEPVASARQSASYQIGFTAVAVNHGQKAPLV